MKQLLVAALLSCACAMTWAQTADELLNNGKNPEHVLNFGMGSETWPHATWPDAWKYGGSATWQSASYDPQLDLLFIGTGNAEPYNPKYRDGMDSLCNM